MNLKPLADRVLIAPTAAEEVTMAVSSFPIPQRKASERQSSCRRKRYEGRGDGTQSGDEVLYGKYAGLKSNSRAKSASSCARTKFSL